MLGVPCMAVISRLSASFRNDGQSAVSGFGATWTQAPVLSAPHSSSPAMSKLTVVMARISSWLVIGSVAAIACRKLVRLR